MNNGKNGIRLPSFKSLVRYAILKLVINQDSKHSIAIEQPGFSLLLIVLAPYTTVCFCSLFGLWHQCWLNSRKRLRITKTVLNFSEWIYVCLHWNEQVDPWSQRQLFQWDEKIHPLHQISLLSFCPGLRPQVMQHNQSLTICVQTLQPSLIISYWKNKQTKKTTTCHPPSSQLL